ncbi:C2H2-type zinc finger protein [Candidatus Sororendozoicomonas aggregata]|uniref:C2H2-type zinc finger protein n=1 Tax=Candidatus Sororendozoicomonas aggregata TaxID=3073239 RepID=UPI002ED388DA
MPKEYVCDECGKEYSRNDHLLSHKRTHSEEKPFVCPICNGRFKYPHSLTRHLRSHAGQGSYQCTECNACFLDSTQLTNHVNSHAVKKPYPCPLCGYGFGRPSDLKKHLANHGKYFYCSVCSRGRFTYKGSYEKHMKKFHGVSVESTIGSQEVPDMGPVSSVTHTTTAVETGVVTSVSKISYPDGRNMVFTQTTTAATATATRTTPSATGTTPPATTQQPYPIVAATATTSDPNSAVSETHPESIERFDFDTALGGDDGFSDWQSDPLDWG